MKYARKKSCMALIFFLALILFSNFTGEINTSATSHENNAQTFKITSTSGENITLAVTGNVSEGQITDFSFMNLPDQYNNTDIDFNMIELNGSNAFVNMTVPKNAILGGTEPVVAINTTPAAPRSSTRLNRCTSFHATRTSGQTGVPATTCNWCSRLS